MFPIASLPQELNDDILIIIGTVDLAVQYKRFWAASKICETMMITESNVINFTNIIPYMTLEKKNKILKTASIYGYSTIVELLLKDPRVDPSISGNFAIQVASKKGHDKVVSLLLADPRIDPTADCNYAIKTAYYYGHYAVIKLLLAHPRIKNPEKYGIYGIYEIMEKMNNDMKFMEYMNNRDCRVN